MSSKKSEYSQFDDAEVIRTQDASADVAISFEHVTKTYHLYKNDRARLAALFSNKVKYEEINANNDLTFEVKRGESVAFLGSNGAGKSTALKMITGVCHPNSGKITINGRVSALLELSAGFDAQLTGLENLEMRGQLWGLSKEETAALIPDIVEFAELGTYINQPMRTYSSGMKSRLGFAFASSIKPDILIVDEALSVGDRRFSKKCLQRVNSIMSDSHVTVLLVTHSSSSAREFCKRGIVLRKGTSVYDGSIDDAIAFYEAD